MTRCLESEELVAIGTAVDWLVEETLDHLQHCNRCREEIARLTLVHRALSAQEVPRAGFTDQVMASIAATDARRARARRLVSVSLTPILAGATAFFAIALAATGPSPIEIGPVAIAASIGVAALIALWDARQRARPGETTVI